MDPQAQEAYFRGLFPVRYASMLTQTPARRAQRVAKTEGNLIVGSLKATELYRFVLDGDRLVHTEILLEDLARIRDVGISPDGTILLLFEHASGSKIVRLVPAAGSG